MQLLTKRRLWPFLVCVLLVAAGCAAWRQTEQGKVLRFSHQKMLHQSVECADCHTETSTGAKAGMPDLETCQTCHEEIDAKKPPELHAASLFKNNVFKAIKVTTIPGEIIFSHKNHTVDHKVGCLECHKGIPESTAITAQVRVTMADCITCHEKTAAAKAAHPAPAAPPAPPAAAPAPPAAPVAAAAAQPAAPTSPARKVAVAEDCASCHQVISKESKPASHAQNWLRFHGEKAKDGDQTGMNQCSLCHTQDSCTTCHKTQQPANHTNLWRQRGHGAAAANDRESCSTCHQSDSCTSCHQTTAPSTHRGQWGGTKDKHCVSCHLPVSGENCSTCHQSGTPSHAKAVPTPATMVGTDCRSCHGVAPKAKLPHVDNGDDCNYCHH